MTGHEELARRYYRALDREDYDDLETLLSQEFTQYRPDVTLEAERFVEFMRSQRPVKDTEHEIEAIHSGPDEELAVVGRVKKDGDELFGFVDVFRFDQETTQITEIRTYSG